VQVSGEATVKASVDYLTMDIGISELSIDPSEAEQRGYDIAISVKSFLIKELALSDSVISTQSSGLQQSYQRPGEKPRYEFRQVFRAELDSVEWFDSVRQRLLEMGAKDVRLVSFGSRQLNQIKRQAYRKAYQNALQQAELLSQSSGMRIVKPLNISSSYRPLNLDGAMEMTAKSDFEANRPSSLIQTHIDVQADVQAEFLLGQ
jgi:uncharacterized protein YggE